MRLTVFATRKMGFMGIKRLLAAGHDIVCVFTQNYDITESFDSDRYKKLCDDNKIPLYITDKVHQKLYVDTLRSLAPDLGVSLYWRRLLHDPVVSIPRYGIINTHASLLPRYRGFAATSWAILRGDKEVGLTVHQVSPGVADDGDILEQEIFPIDESTNIQTLFEVINERSVDLNVKVVNSIASGKSHPTPQPEEGVVLSYPRLPIDGKINWHDTAENIDRLVRAVTRPYPGAFTYANHQGIYKKLFVWKARVVKNHPPFVGVPGHVIKNDPHTGESSVVTGKGILALQEIQNEDQPPFQPGQVWKNLQMRLGMIPEEAILTLQNLLLTSTTSGV